MAANVGNKLFIPTRIKVGFQKRNDTYTKRLAYVIYFDAKGKLRKETSWESWRDKSIEAEEFDNTPHSGFVLNKDVKRSSEWFSSGRNMIRVYDDRGVEFEITTGNLLFILMTTDCLKRGLTGEFVYAWQGTELVLLPVDCDEYRASANFTQLQHTKVSTKNLIPGCSYKTRKGEDYIYLGKFDWLDGSRVHDHYVISSKKKHVFIGSNNELRTIDPSSLAVANTDIPVSNYAELVDIFTHSPRASKAVELISRPAEKPNEKFFIKVGQKYVSWRKRDWYGYGYGSRPVSGFMPNATIWMDEGEVKFIYDQYSYGYSREKPSDPPGERIDLLVRLQSGNVVTLEEYTKELGYRYHYYY